MQPEGERVSALTTADGEPVMETTVVLANGGDGVWCDVDAYLDLEAPLEGHAYTYVNYLQQNESADTAMVVVETEIAAGPAFRIELFDQATGRGRDGRGRQHGRSRGRACRRRLTERCLRDHRPVASWAHG